MPEAQKQWLRELATKAAHNSYSPYSGFRVGAALLLSNGEAVTGTNVEICSFRLTCCAEQSAVVRAVAQFGPTVRVRAVAIANLNGEAARPCGACRQTLAEFGDDNVTLLYPGDGGKPEEMRLGELFPQAFRLQAAAPKAADDEGSAH